MDVVEVRVGSAASAAGSLGRLNSFAALQVGQGTDPLVGGFRFVPAQGARRSLVMRRVVRRCARPLPLAFFGCLALAILARPGSEPQAALSQKTNTPAITQAWPSIASEAYMNVAMGEEPAQRELAALEEAGTMTATSPITTSALPSPADTTLRELRTEPKPLGLLPPGSETLADAPPKLVRLAAVAPTDDELGDILPAAEEAGPSESALDAGSGSESEAEAAEAAAERAISKPRATSARVRKARSRKTAKKGSRAPRWAQQMFDNPWQSSAFSYTR